MPIKYINKNHLSPNATPSTCLDSTFYVGKPLCQFLKISRVQGHITLSDVAFPHWDHKLVTRDRSLLSPPKKIPKSSQGQYQALWIYVLLISGLSNQKTQIFPWYL